ncbi:MarR family winged helix-turn-helix transcriptional regulator [Pelagibacterium lentulum]|uniref:MarR family transcriptional regulator n=1 Tax=Pelagibacterium lentulum TaxID=2029865 RepID=A0A916RIN7_9HYPH|nr:MarR family winged helix-turn-helix transcriptional regulator [Pelagibacterium lentulum]GGA57326.1 MarR family transcriptional regulator [Pelagibacterium lentulum]
MSSNLLRTANLLATVSGAVQVRIDDQLKQHPNQTSSSLAALNVIGMSDGCTNAALSQTIGLSHTATVRLVDKLEAQGLVVGRQLLDRRSVELTLTAEGKVYARTLLAQRCLATGTIVELLGSDEQHELTRLLEKILQRLAGQPSSRGHLCRLCDEMACPPQDCPVHHAHSHA